MVVLVYLISTVLWLGVWIPFYLLGFLCTWLGLIFTTRNSEHMWFPWWFWDNNHGINGTLGYNNLNWVAICNPDVMMAPDPESAARGIVDRRDGNERRYGNRWLWTTWRNPVTNVSMYLIGARIRREVVCKSWSFGPFLIERGSAGLLRQYGFTIFYPGRKRSFYWSFGWKVLDPSEGRARFMYRISPYRAVP